MWRRIAVVLFLASFPGQLWAGASNSLLDISTDGTLLAAANRDNGTVSIVDLATGKVLHEVAVGGKPEGVSFVGKSHLLAVTAYSDDQVALVDADAGTKVARDRCLRRTVWRRLECRWD